MRLSAYLHRAWGCRGDADTLPEDEYADVIEGLVNAVADHLHATRGCKITCRHGLADDGDPAHREAWKSEAERLLSR